MTREQAEELRNDILEANVLEDRLAYDMSNDLNHFLKYSNYNDVKISLQTLKTECTRYGWDLDDILTIMKDEM